MSEKKTKRKVFLASVVVLGIALIAGRIYMPFWLTDYVNDEINALDNYSGGIDDIEVSLWRGAYQIYGLHIDKIDGGLDAPFIAAETIDLSLNWPALINGAVVAELDVYTLNFNFAPSQTGQGEGGGWANLVRALSPFDINRLDVHSGRVAFIDPTADPAINLFIENIEGQVTNLRQVENAGSKLPSSISISGTSVGGGTLAITGGVNILKDIPDFDISMALEDADLTAFNDYSNHHAAIDFNEGRLGIFGELAAADGKVVGYIKPIATDIDLVSLDQDTNLFNILWESLSALFIQLFENQSTDQFAMRIPIEGDLNSPDSDMWSGFWSIFANAFGNAFSRDEDGTVNFNDALEETEDVKDTEPGEKAEPPAEGMQDKTSETKVSLV